MGTEDDPFLVGMVYFQARTVKLPGGTPPKTNMTVENSNHLKMYGISY